MKILLIDSTNTESIVKIRLGQLVSNQDYNLTVADVKNEQPLELLQTFNIVILNLDALPTDVAQVDKVQTVRKTFPKVRLLTAGAFVTWQMVRSVLLAGALDFIDYSRQQDESMLAAKFEAYGRSLEPGNGEMKRKTLLIIENNSQVRNALREQIKVRLGCRVLDVSTLEDAMAVLNSEIEKIDLVILDLRMRDDNDISDISGVLFAENQIPSVPKVIYTAFPNNDNVQRLLRTSPLTGERAAINIVSKEDSPDELIMVISKILS